jgi:hypothetical protein
MVVLSNRAVCVSVWHFIAKKFTARYCQALSGFRYRHIQTPSWAQLAARSSLWA